MLEVSFIQAVILLCSVEFPGNHVNDTKEEIVMALHFDHTTKFTQYDATIKVIKNKI